MRVAARVVALDLSAFFHLGQRRKRQLADMLKRAKSWKGADKEKNGYVFALSRYHTARAH
ncbi:hypothetical protein E1293_40785 [Actinomadura darangshiensis]|uniref:Uncharacterized protein n=1 Tax=Actinomadura darangshiensis TaxID=705336 RepID=A0A4R5A2K1_9ACTN|nr:hypothetical protein [Actinomadura darangshiensis]TDD65046.1 hypothetical protein E1293_40785 [Actinomadura darangshiensis]